jgi:ribonucleotide monophosphatase NagD (HAD superfamily)
MLKHQAQATSPSRTGRPFQGIAGRPSELVAKACARELGCHSRRCFAVGDLDGEDQAARRGEKVAVGD